MTTKTGDKTKAQILADSNIDLVQWNKNLNFHALKAIKTANDFVPSVSGDWATAPTSQDAALNELGADKTDLIALSGVARAAQNLGTFSGSTIADNQTVKAALQALETSLELKAVDTLVVHLTGAETLASKSIKSSSALVDETDITKTLKWNLAAQSTGVDITLTTGIETADRILNIPVLGGDKTIDLIDLNQTVTAVKTFSGANVHFDTMTVVDAAATPKAIGFSTTAATASTKVTLAARQAGNITVRLPAAAGDIALTSDIGADVRATATVALTQAEIIGMFAAPKLLVAAPAAGSAIVVENIEVLHTYAVAQYSGGGAAKVQYKSTVNGAGVLLGPDLDAIIKAGSTSNGLWSVTNSAVDMADVTAQGLYLSNIAGAYADGDASNVLKLRISYRVVAVVA